MHPLLDGTRVVEFSQLIAAPFCGLTLADLGAEVIKVESPAGDPSRGFPPYVEGDGALFHALNRGKRGVTLDFSDPADRPSAADLIANADVVVENLGPAASALGTSYAEVSRHNPGLIWCSISATGSGGTDRAVDGSVQAEWGVMGLTGEFGGPPVRAGVSLIDYMTGMYAVQRVLTALWERERGAGGAFIDCAMIDASATLTAMQSLLAHAGTLSPRRVGSESHLRVPTGAFPCADGGFVQVTCVSERHWQALCRALEHPEWIEDPRYETLTERMSRRDEMRNAVAAGLGTSPAAHWVARIRAEGGLCEPIRDIADVWADPRMRERGLVGRLAADDRIPFPLVTFAGTAPLDGLPLGPSLGDREPQPEASAGG
jgi:crotonobetainyl-CoA:carnitine CoA-transferase CaiB-like acyl-CoA transferase